MGYEANKDTHLYSGLFSFKKIFGSDRTMPKAKDI